MKSDFFYSVMSIVRPALKLDLKAFLLELKLRGPKFYQRYIEKKYCDGFCALDRNEIQSSKVQQWYNKFKESDYVRVSGQTDLVALFSDSLPSQVNKDAFGRAKYEYNNLTSDQIINSLDDDIKALLSFIYGRKFWVRDSAFFMHHAGNKAKEHIQASWHVDGYNQVTMQLLMSESGNDSVATEIIPGSSSQDWNFNRSSISLSPEYQSNKFRGKVGDLFIFNGGGALHRSYIGAEPRKAVFINLSSGWYEADLL